MRSTCVERRGGQGGKQPHELWNGLSAFSDRRHGLGGLRNKRAVERATPADLDHIASASRLVGSPTMQ